jgi:tetratricopeptide (TPR) repeat protein
LPRAAARLHDARGLDAYARGDYEAARRAFARAVAADPGFADGLYNAAAVAARTGHDTEAVAFLTRAAAADPRRVQVLGRDDPDFSALRRRDDVRALLGLVRLPPEGVPQP